MKLSRLVMFVALLTAGGLSAAEPKVETILEGLINPCGVAIQPETGVVFVSDSGAGKVLRVVDGKAQDVIGGSPKDVYGKGPKYDIGPLGIAFFDKSTLVVGDGGFVDGEEFVRVFTVPEAGGKALDFDKDAKVKAGPLPATDELKAEGNFYALAVSKTAVYITSNGDDTKGWVHRLPIEGTKFGKLERWLATKEAVEVDAPVGITLSPRGEIVVGQMGEVNLPNDSLLTFYSAASGKKLLNLETKLHDITALAYHPKSGLLYATDFAWAAPDEGGLYRIDRGTKQGDPAVKTTKIVALEKPTAMAFAADGALYVATIGSPGAEETAAKTGKLVKITIE
jgi:DNA-binding beta-propeller fold protein YncE